jgi:hypothetical protein
VTVLPSKAAWWKRVFDGWIAWHEIGSEIWANNHVNRLGQGCRVAAMVEMPMTQYKGVDVVDANTTFSEDFDNLFQSFSTRLAGMWESETATTEGG